MDKKIRIGIDLDEVIRGKWSQFDKYYYEEFGDDNLSDDGNYCIDLFDGYVWEDKNEVVKILNEDVPDNINPKYYHESDNDNKSIDDVIFNTEKHNLTAKEVFNRFIYEDYVFEIFGSSKLMKPQLDNNINKMLLKYKDNVEFILFSEENKITIPFTLFFLSKSKIPFNEYKFYDDKLNALNDVDIIITTDPKLIDDNDNTIIKLQRPYNKDTKNNGVINELTHVDELLDNIEFEKLINYTQDNN